MQDSKTKEQIKVYKAYSFNKGWFLLIPWCVLPILIVAFALSILFIGNYLGANARIIYFLCAVIMLLNFIPFGLVAVHISWALLGLGEHGIKYNNGILTTMNSAVMPFRIEKVDIYLPWNEIKSVYWENEENRLMIIETTIGKLTFEVFRQPDTNAEIMRELKTHEHEFAKGAIHA